MALVMAFFEAVRWSMWGKRVNGGAFAKELARLDRINSIFGLGVEPILICQWCIVGCLYLVG
jgi:hypothetical protein